MNASLYMKYIGVLSLLGRVSSKANADDKACIEQAMTDANTLFKKMNAGIRFEPTAGGGWASFEV